MDCRAQVSFEYLLTLAFVVLLVIAATILALNMTAIAQVAQTKILSYREQTISSILGG